MVNRYVKSDALPQMGPNSRPNSCKSALRRLNDVVIYLGDGVARIADELNIEAKGRICLENGLLDVAPIEGLDALVAHDLHVGDASLDVGHLVRHRNHAGARSCRQTPRSECGVGGIEELAVYWVQLIETSVPWSSNSMSIFALELLEGAFEPLVLKAFHV